MKESSKHMACVTVTAISHSLFYIILNLIWLIVLFIRFVFIIFIFMLKINYEKVREKFFLIFLSIHGEKHLYFRNIYKNNFIYDDHFPLFFISKCKKFKVITR